MKTEAIAAGFYETEYGKFPKIQILTITELFTGKQPQLPWRDIAAFKKAARGDANVGKQNKAAALESTSMSDMLILVAWIGAVFALGFAAGWFARRRSSRRRGRRRLDLR